MRNIKLIGACLLLPVIAVGCSYDTRTTNALPGISIIKTIDVELFSLQFSFDINIKWQNI